nr:hypothetical protein Iba_chr05bCG4350 [Ipomoea batatas]
MQPKSWLLDKARYSSCVNKPISEGILPVKLLLSINKEVNCVQLAMRCGTNLPERLLEDKSKSTSLERLDILGGNSPVVIAQVQKSELKEAADSSWYHSAQTIVLQIDANPPELQMIPSQLHTFVRLLTDQEESSKEDDRPLIFHCKRASASSLFACKGAVFTAASKQRM